MSLINSIATWQIWVLWAAIMGWLLFLVWWPRTPQGKFLTPAQAVEYYDEHARHWGDFHKLILTIMILLGYAVWLLLRRRF